MKQYEYPSEGVFNDESRCPYPEIPMTENDFFYVVSGFSRSTMLSPVGTGEFLLGSVF